MAGAFLWDTTTVTGDSPSSRMRDPAAPTDHDGAGTQDNRVSHCCWSNVRGWSILTTGHAPYRTPTHSHRRSGLGLWRVHTGRPRVQAGSPGACLSPDSMAC